MSYIYFDGEPYRIIGSSRTERQTISLELIRCEDAEVNEKVFKVIKYKGGEFNE